MLKFKEGQTYICAESYHPWWTAGKEYSVINSTTNRPTIQDDSGTPWYDYEVNILGYEFKLKNETQMLNLKEGQTYICKRDDLDNWTLDKEYKVKKFSNGRLYITDDNQDDWYLPSDNLLNQRFKLKEKTFDLNKLTTAELREYLELLENKEKSESLLNEFIERMTK